MRAFLSQCQKLDEDELLQLAHGLLEAQTLIPGDCLQEVLETAASVLSVNSEVLCDDWGKVVEAISKLAQLHEVRDVCVPLVLGLCSSGRPTYMRRVGALLIGVMSEILGRFFPGTLLDRAISQSQDPSYEMRKTMCRVLNKMSDELGNTETIYPSVELLMHDDDSRVREEAIALFLNVFPSLSEETVTSRALALLQSLMATAKDKVMMKMGTLIPAVSAFPDSSYYSEILLNAYVEALGGQPDGKVRALAVFPDVARVLDQALFETRLVYCYMTLTMDPDVTVKRAVAAIFHSVSCLMVNSPASVAKLKGNLLRDNEVLWDVVEHLDEWNPELLDETVFSRVRELLLSKKSWRTKEALLQRLTHITSVNLSCLLCQHIVPALTSLMHEECAALRTACTHLIVRLLSVIYQTSARQELVTQLVTEFASSEVYRDRLLFIDLCLEAISSCSLRFLKTHLLPSLLQLGSDTVLPVKLKFAASLSLIRD